MKKAKARADKDPMSLTERVEETEAPDLLPPKSEYGSVSEAAVSVPPRF